MSKYLVFITVIGKDQPTFKITRPRELIGRELASNMNVPFGIVDISLASTTKVGDSVAGIVELMGVEKMGAPGSTAALALLIDAVNGLLILGEMRLDKNKNIVDVPFAELSRIKNMISSVRVYG